MIRIGFFLAAAAGVATAAEVKAVGRGSTRDEVIAAFGRPSGQTKAGHVEILHFSNRQVRLENGRVERISSKDPVRSFAVPEKPPLTGATSLSAAPSESSSPLAEVWITNFEAAMRDAARRHSVVLALFATSDASPAARQFQREIALHPEFVNAFRAHYVLLHLDFPVRDELAPPLHAQNASLRERYGISRFPALVILSAAGEKLAAVEIPDSIPTATSRARLIAAISAAYELPAPVATAPATPVVQPPVPSTSPAAQAPAPEAPLVAPTYITSGLAMARGILIVAIAVGSLLAGLMLFVLWLVIRKINKPVALNRRATMATRISQAASGLPSYEEMRTWPKETLCHVVIGLAESEGFVAIEQPAGSDKDLVLKRPGSVEPEVVVCCVTGNAGVIPTRRIREMVGILAAEGMPAGWFVSPTGFSVDAVAYAEQNNIRMIDASVLLGLLSDLPSFELPKVLTMVK